MRNTNTERKLMLFNTLYERGVPSMSRVQCLKDGKMNKIHFLASSRSLDLNGGFYDFVS